METLISSNTAEALGWTILHSLWQATLVGILLMLLLKLMKNGTSTQRYFISLAALSMVVVMALVTFFTIYRPLAPIASTGLSEAIWLDIATLQASEKTWEDYISLAFSFANSYSPQISLLWIIGVVILSIRFLINLIYIHQLKTYKVKPASMEWEGRLKAIAQKINIHRQIKLVESALVEVPTVVGWLKPAILFPLGMFTALPPYEIESILAHELAHIRRNDFIINILQSVIEILFFYHPAVWFISKQIESERENCCDDIAVAVAGDSLTYIKALTHLATLKINHLSPALAITGKNGGLLQRVNRIARNAKLVNRWARQHTISPKLTAATIVIMSVLLLATKTEATTYLVEKLEQTPLEFLVKPFESEEKTQEKNKGIKENIALNDTTKKAQKAITASIDELAKSRVVTFFGDTLKLEGVGRTIFYNIKGDSLGKGILFMNPYLSKIKLPLDKFEIDTIESKFGNICTYKIKGFDSLNNAWSWLHDGNNLIPIPSLKKMSKVQVDSLMKELNQKGAGFQIFKDSLTKNFKFMSNDQVTININADATAKSKNANLSNNITINHNNRNSTSINTVTINLADPASKNDINLSNKVTINTGGATIISGQNAGGKNPLYVIDGKPLPKGNINSQEAFKNIDVKEIASISVLKGKSATDKYGENGKDGVVEIITKQGQKNGLSVPKEDLSTSPVFSNQKVLLVIDGEVIEKSKNKETLKKIQPQDIISMNILKNKTATDIYGEEGKDGVIVITTRKSANAYKKEEIEAKEDKIDVRIFPNPSRSEVNIRFLTESNDPIWVEAYDIKGEKVATILDGAKLNKGQNNISWDTNALPTGAYIIKIKQGTTFSQHKIILD